MRVEAQHVYVRNFPENTSFGTLPVWRFGQKNSEPRREGKQLNRFLGESDRLGTSWHSICLPIITSIFVHNWVRGKIHMPVITGTAGRKDHRQPISFMGDMKGNISTWHAKEKERGSLAHRSCFNWFCLLWRTGQKHGFFNRRLSVKEFRRV